MPCNRRQTECHQVYLNGRGAKEEGEAKEEVDEVKTKNEIQLENTREINSIQPLPDVLIMPSAEGARAVAIAATGSSGIYEFFII